MNNIDSFIPVPRINDPNKFSFMDFEKYYREDLTKMYYATKRFMKERNIMEIWENIDYNTFVNYIYKNSFKSKLRRF